MPELPEVETVRRGLLPVMEGEKIASVDVNRLDLRWPFPENMADRIAGTTVTALARRSKYVLAHLDSGETLIIHLGMSGRILITGATLGEFFHPHVPVEKHDHVVFHMASRARVTFNDPRRFGAMDLVRTDQMEDHKFFQAMGPEPFSNAFNESYLAEALKGRKSPSKSALLDQKLVAGLGNIYVCEALFESGISPKRTANRIAKRKIPKLFSTIKSVLQRAIDAGGSTLNDYRQADGDLGYFQHSFKVYGREGELCLTENCDGRIKRIVQSGRSTFYCSNCQR